MLEIHENVVANTISPLCYSLALEKGLKTKTTKLIGSCIGSTWVQLERVSPNSSPTH